jgi:hypothetical protein
MDGNNEYRDTLQDEQSDDGLGENIYYLQEKSWTETFTWRSLMLTEHGIYLSSVIESRPEVFVRKVDERSFFVKRMVLSWPMVTALVLDDGVLQIEWFDPVKGKSRRSRMKLEEPAEALNVAAIIASKKGWRSHSRPSTLWRGLLTHGVGLSMVVAFTWLLLNDAARIEAGMEPDFSGRRIAAQVFFWNTAGWLGTTGVWVAGAVAMAAVLVLTVRWYRGRQPAVVWREMP